jgi:hypothetical protein
MDDFYDDFDDEFEDGDFMDDSDGDFETDDPFDEDSGIEEEPTDAICDDEFTTKDAVILGSAMGWAYEEGLEEAERRKLEKKMDDEEKLRISNFKT